MKHLPNESNLNNGRRQNSLKRKLKTPKNANSLLIFSNYFNSNRKPLEINNLPSKEKVDKAPINKRIQSLKVTNTKKRKIYESRIFSKVSIRKMEKDIRNRIILSSKQIKLDMISDDFNEGVISKTLTSNLRSKILEEIDTRKSNKMENDKDMESLKIDNNNNHNYYKKLSPESLININSLDKLNTFPTNNQKNILLKISSKNILNYNKEKTKALINEQNYRKIVRTKILYDSFEDNESDNENERQGFFLSPYGIFIKSFDFLMSISTLIIVIFNPYYLSIMKCFCFPKPLIIKYIYMFIDLLFICDLLLGFWRAYYNHKFQLVTKVKYIIKHYLSTQFLIDLIQSFPVFTLINFQCEKNENNTCSQYSMNTNQILLIIFTSFKHLKFFKITNKKTNSLIFQLYELTNEKYFAEHILDILIIFFSIFFCFFTLISIHIFIANHNFPNWIESNNLMDKNIFLLYLNSFYFITTTITTVGYGDMIGNSIAEAIFRIILLTVGISLYSWIVSNIGSYVDNESRISIRFNKDEAILEEIRISYPNMPYKLYNQILHHLELRKLRQKKLDSNILINSLPYSLRNTVLFAVHKQVITNFKIFKKCQNSDFINQVLTNFIPLFSKKNAILIYENQLIENLIFIKNGRLSLEAAIDIETPIKSINEYFNFKFADIIDNNKTESSVHLTPKNLEFEGDKVKINESSEKDESIIHKEIGKCEFEGEEFEESNYQFINIVNIMKNESYGIVYMFLSKPSPPSLRVKSKKAELFLLRKPDAVSISKKFPNIWKKQYKKSYINMNSIKKRTINKLKDYCQASGIAFQVNETPHFNQNLTIKEILEKAKQKEAIKSLKSLTSISNIFKEHDKAHSLISPCQRLLNITTLKKESVSSVSNLPTNIKSVNSSQNLGTFGKNKHLKFENNALSFTGERSPNIGLNLYKNNLKRFSNNSSKIKSERMSKFKILSQQETKSVTSTKNERPSFGKIIKMQSQKLINRNRKFSSPLSLKKNYIIKLKRKIKNLKVSKIYYKTLFKKVSDKLKDYKKNSHKNLTNEIIMTLNNYKSERKRKQSKYNDNEKEKDQNKTSDNDDNKNPKVINNVIVQNNNNYICSFSDFISSDSKNSSSSLERKVELSIEKNDSFSYNGEYLNLKELTNGEIINNSKFMKTIFSHVQDLYIELMKEKQKKTIMEKMIINNSSNRSLDKKSKKLLKFYSENFLNLSSLLSEDEHKAKKRKMKKKLNKSISPNKNNKIKNLNLEFSNKNNFKLENSNLNNYYFKINTDNSPNKKSNISKEQNAKNLINNYLSVKNIQKENNNNLAVSFLKNQLSHKKSFTTECEWDKKSIKSISSFNDNNNNKDMSFQENHIERKILESINNYNSSTEQKFKSYKINRKKHDFNNIKNEIINRNSKKKEKNKTKEKTVQDYEYCFIF